MVETEVSRLRKLRKSALRVRAVARALARTGVAHDEPVLNESACAAWRVARAVSGHLRAHPYARFQRDAGLRVVFSNAFVAAGAAVSATSRARALRGFSSHLRKLSRELADARALTWTPDLSDSFGRSLSEFRPLLAKAEVEARIVPPPRQSVVTRAPVQNSVYRPTPDHDWPYIAL